MLHRRKKLIVEACLVFICICAVSWSVEQFGAGNAYYRVKNSIEGWQQEPSEVARSEIEKALSSISFAINKFPSNALYYQVRGQVYEWLVFTALPEQDIGKAEHLRLAAKDYHRSLQLRPTWAGSWIGLASIKWQLNQLDNAFYTYLYNAEKYGPQDPITHRFFAEFGLNMFSMRSVHFAKVNVKLKKHIRLGLVNPLSRKHVLASIAKYDAKRTVCVWLESGGSAPSQNILGCS